MTTNTPLAGERAATSFTDLGVHDDLVTALAEAGIATPFPIQELTLPMGLAGADIIGQARTGTGKTLAFGLPLLQRVSGDDKRTQALVIVPTRELCLQVRDDLARAGERRGVEVVAAYGGRPLDPQAKAIADGAPVVIGTPGRLLDLLRREQLDLSTVTGVVLDEADEMLDLGFLPDVEQLIEATATPRQTLLFSATMPPAVVGLARRYMTKPTFLRADVEESDVGPETQQYFFSCHKLDKPAVMARILSAPGRGLSLVFVRTKRMADVLAADLSERGISAAPIHSDLRQEARERTLARFRKGTIDTLIATEVAARGLDIDDVTHVVNYDCPDDEKRYLHRIGRTGRAGSSGVAITLAMWNEAARLEMIKRALDITDPTHEVFSTSPILTELFDLPADEPRVRKTGSKHAPGRSASKRGPAKAKRGASARGVSAAAKNVPAEAKDAADEAEPSTDSAGESQGHTGRARRRARRDAENGVDETRTRIEAASTAPTPSAETASNTEDGRPTTRRRTRTRTRIGAAADATDGPSRDVRKPVEGPGEQTPSRKRTRTRRAPQPRAEAESNASAKVASPHDDEPGQGVTAPAEAAPRPPRETSRSGSRRNDSRRRRGSSRSKDQRSGPGGKGGHGRPKPAADKTELRDGGQPRLRRPLEVTHLP